MILKKKDMSLPTTPKAVKAAADKEARSLGYNPDQMAVRIYKEKEGWRVYYEPKPLPQLAVTGGDLTIYLKDDGQVTEVLRGQ